jgi:hypothetical protein
VLALNDAPRELIAQSIPLAAGFTFACIVVLSLLYGSRWLHYLSITITSVLLVTLLGLNVAIVGLVDIPSSGVFLVVEMFALIILLDLVFMASFLVFEHRTFSACPPNS